MYRKYQMARIIEVASLIHKEPRRWTRPRLAARLQVNPATIQRYIVLLRDMGIEIVPRGKQGYELEVVRTNFLWSVNRMVRGILRCAV
jgi:predicted DNA-binding transcriptional regulator YafY